MKLSLIIPCYNEEQVIEKFYETADGVFSQEEYDVEYIFVNDGSTDKTPDILKNIYKASDNKISVITFSRNFGKEAAMFAGLKASRGEYVSIIDADLQQRPELVARMVKLLDKYPEYDCIGTVAKTNGKDHGPIKWMKKRFYKIISKLSHIDFEEGASDFRTFRRNMADAVIEMGDYHRFTKGLFAWVGFNTRYLPYEVQSRGGGESKWSVSKLLRYALDGIIAFSSSPLRFATVFGALFSSFSIFYLLFYIVFMLIGKYEMTPLAVIMALIVMFGGFILIAIGIAGEYLAKIYDQVKSRPIYIEKEVFTPENRLESLEIIDKQQRYEKEKAARLDKRKEELRQEKKKEHIENLKASVGKTETDEYIKMIKEAKKSSLEKTDSSKERSDIAVMEKKMESRTEKFINEISAPEDEGKEESEKPVLDKKSAKTQRRAEKERLKQEKKARKKGK